MKFEIHLKRGSITSFFRDCGYMPLGIDTKEQELVFAKSLSGASYPRFHAYCKSLPNAVFAVNLHLDQKRPTYHGVTAHSGEYESPLLIAETQRIKNMVQ